MTEIVKGVCWDVTIEGVQYLRFSKVTWMVWRGESLEFVSEVESLEHQFQLKNPRIEQAL